METPEFEVTVENLQRRGEQIARRGVAQEEIRKPSSIQEAALRVAEYLKRESGEDTSHPSDEAGPKLAGAAALSHGEAEDKLFS